MKRIYTLVVALLLTLTTQAQSPELMTYQALLRNSEDKLLTTTEVGMRISLLQQTVDGTVVYTETHSASTNANGLLTLNIGTGTTSDDFSSIDWSQGPYFIKTETDPSGGDDYSITATSQLLSVPYALHSKTAETADSLTGMTLYYGDRDGDAYGDKFNVVKSTTPVEGYVLDNTDCDDFDSTTNPDKVWYIDSDGDGYGGSSKISCVRPANGFNLSELSGTGLDDCDDTDNNQFPEQIWFIDADGDGFGAISEVSCERPNNGFELSELSGTGLDDCDDSNSNVYPKLWYIDADADGYGGSSVTYCERPANGFKLSELSGTGLDDCDDTDNNQFPGRIWYDRSDVSLFVESCQKPENGLLLSEIYGDVGCDDLSSDTHLLVLSFDFDKHPTEIEWILEGPEGEVLEGSGNDGDSHSIQFSCLPDGFYRLKVYDTFGDGLLQGGGSIRLKLGLDSSPAFLNKIDFQGLNFMFDYEIKDGVYVHPVADN